MSWFASLLAAAAILGYSSLEPILPDTTISPGATLTATAQQVCRPGYARAVRHVSDREKRAVFVRYGIPWALHARYEVDHLISLELGGSNEMRNLWPESYETQPWNARTKDRLENELHRLVCAGKLPLKVAQDRISANWIGAYRQFVGDP